MIFPLCHFDHFNSIKSPRCYSICFDLLCVCLVICKIKIKLNTTQKNVCVCVRAYLHLRNSRYRWGNVRRQNIDILGIERREKGNSLHKVKIAVKRQRLHFYFLQQIVFNAIISHHISRLCNPKSIHAVRHRNHRFAAFSI